MPSPWSRRKALHLCCSACVFGLAGCSASLNDATSPTPSSERISSTALDFDIDVLRQFTDEHPARIRAALTNETETALTLFMGTTPPFTSYLSERETSEAQLILVPDRSGSTSSGNPLDWPEGVGEPVPTTSEDGCWRITHDVAIEDGGLFVGVGSGETIDQAFDVFTYQSSTCHPAGRYEFEDRAEVQRGEPPSSGDTPMFQVTLSFALTIHDDGSVTAEVDPPTVDDTPS